jgi:hypothetical protein
LSYLVPALETGRYILPSPFRKLIQTQEEFLQVLLEDDDLCNVLRRKPEWKFSALVAFHAVIKRKPSLVSSAGMVSIENIDVDHAPIIRGLRVFTSLTSLSIDTRARGGLVHTLDLDNIACSCPLLENVALLAFNDFYGSLASLQHVKEVSIFAPRASHINDIPHLSSLVPFNSAHCLTKLTFVAPTNWGDLHDTASNPFDPFVKLTTLKIDPFSPLIFDVIADSNLSILEVTTSLTWDEQSQPALFRMLSATSLKLLRKLKVGRNGDNYRFDRSHFSAIAGLEHLEHLDLQFQIPQAWWFALARMRTLNYLCGIVDDRDIDKEEGKVDSLEVLASAVKRVGAFSRVRLGAQWTMRKRLHCYRGSDLDPWPDCPCHF